MSGDDLYTKMQVIEHRLSNLESIVKDIQLSIKNLEKWASIQQAEHTKAERSSDKIVKRATLGATLALVMTAIASIVYRGPTS